jgi:SMI1 / KNR4 family (SUKH-1)
MNLRSLLLSGDYQWEGNPPATAEDIAALEAAFPVPLPTEYLSLLRFSDGGEAKLSGYPTYVRIWTALQSINFNDGYQVSHWLPGFIGFGDNGGPDMVGFDTREGEPYPVCSVPFAPIEWESAVGRISDFREFISQLKPKA